MNTALKLFSALLLVCTSLAFAQDAEFIWAEDDLNGSRILLSEYKDGSWQPAEKIVEDDKLNILPAIGSDTKGHRVVVWSTLENEKSVLKYIIRRDNQWSSPQILTNQMSTNLAPVIAFDRNDICWVFWSANNGNDDDIYASRFQHGVWSSPQMVNEDNDVPDILPETGQDENGNIWVSWQQLQQQGYVEISKTFEAQSHKTIASQYAKKLNVNSNFENSIKPPSFHRSLGRASMHFPKNRNRPSRAVEGNRAQ